MTIDLEARVFVRREHGFVPADVHAEEMLKSVKLNAEIILSRRSARNPSHHRRLFGLLKVVCEHSERYNDLDVLLYDLKIATGLYRTAANYLTGEVYPVADSISFASMTQARFDEWYAIAVEKMSEHLGTDVDTLAAEVWAATDRKASA